MDGALHTEQREHALEHGRSTALLPGVLLPFGFVLADVFRVMTTPPRSIEWPAVLHFAAVSWALGAVLGMTALALRAQWVAALARRGRSGEALTGALDALALFALVVLLQDPNFVLGDKRVLALIGSVGGFALVRWLYSRLYVRARLTIEQVISAVCFAAGLYLLSRLRWNSDAFARLALHVAVGAALANLLPRSLGALRLRTRFGIAALALVPALAASFTLPHSAQARQALLQQSSHARSWAFVYELIADWDGDGATRIFGGSDCDETRSDVYPGASERPGNGIDDNCAGGDAAPVRRPAAPPRAASDIARSDVLILSIDSLRWDGIDELPELAAALAPYARFDRAVSPSSRTRDSLAATIRGRPARALRFDPGERPRRGVLWRDMSPTLGHVLVQAGYRAINFPTNDMSDPRAGVAAGFETIALSNFDARHSRTPIRPGSREHVSFEQLTPIVRDAARNTPHPLCVWMHLMEPHYPYRVAQAAASETAHARYRRSLRELDAKLAAFVAELTRLRGQRPLVAVFGDHGEEFGEHGGRYHASTVYAEQVRVGMLLSGPGIAAGRYAQPVSTMALPATLLELLGLRAPASMVEPSLVPALRAQVAWPKLAVSEHRAQNELWVGYTGERYRYLYDPVHAIELLFDADHDPLERRDLVAEKPAALAAMRAHARAWDEQH